MEALPMLFGSGAGAASGLGGLAGGLLTTALSKAMSPKTPKMPETKVAPVTDDKQAKSLQQRQMMRQYAGAGREGTALSVGSKLG